MAMGSVHQFTDAELATLRALYPTTATTEVARRMGLTVKQVYNAADRYKVFKEGYRGERRQVDRSRKAVTHNSAAASFSGHAELPSWLAPRPVAVTSWDASGVHRHHCMDLA